MTTDQKGTGSSPAAIAAMSASYEESMRAGRGPDAERIALACLAEGLGVATLYEEVIAPAMARIGELWAEGAMTIADEHLASALNFKVMASVYSVSLAGRTTVDRGRVLLAGVEGDRHGVGLRMAGDVLELAGFDLIFLGEDVASRDIVLAVESGRPDVVAIAVPTEAAREAAATTVRMLHRSYPDIPVLVGGQGASAGPPEGALALAPRLAELVDTVADLVPADRAPATGLWTTSLDIPLRAAADEDASPEDRLLEIASEAADAARAHARVAHAYRRLAHEDPLTRAPNRRAFDDRIEELLAGGVEASLILIDLDGFKQVNDRLGHPAGDRVLREVASVISRTIPADGFMARLGGDEFAVLVQPSPTAPADELAASLLAKLREQVRDPEITATAGVAPLARGRRQSMIQADLALYRAKAEGGDAVAAA
jgi:diguanylate cyclase (GGDEF)-like protein